MDTDRVLKIIKLPYGVRVDTGDMFRHTGTIPGSAAKGYIFRLPERDLLRTIFNRCKIEVDEAFDVTVTVPPKVVDIVRHLPSLPAHLFDEMGNATEWHISAEEVDRYIMLLQDRRLEDALAEIDDSLLARKVVEQ